MIKVPAAEFQRNIGRYQDLALTQPVAVTRNGRERTVMISIEEYQRLKRRDRECSPSATSPRRISPPWRRRGRRTRPTRSTTSWSARRVALPVPVPGLVIRYSYLWQAEHVRGREEGVKDRPCVVIFRV
jgi:PHD/YefM family antitoxin component YafN of YafNO toxin-antitoxin module